MGALRDSPLVAVAFHGFANEGDSGVGTTVGNHDFNLSDQFGMVERSGVWHGLAIEDPTRALQRARPSLGDAEIRSSRSQRYLVLADHLCSLIILRIDCHHPGRQRGL